MSDELFNDDWYANQFALAVGREEPWAVYYLEQIGKSMTHYLNYTPLLKTEKSDGPGELS